MTASQKFLFDTSFEPEDMAARATAIPLEDHSQALQVEYAKGVEKGREEAQAGIDARNTEQLQDLNLKLITLLEEQEKYRGKVQTLVAEVLRKSLEKLFPAVAKAKGLDDILQVVSKTFDTEAPGREMTVFAHPETVDALQEKLTSLNQTKSQPIIFKVQEDAALSFSDCRITWEGGGLERLSGRLYQEIDVCLQRLSVTEEIEMTIPEKEVLPEEAAETTKET